MMPRLRGRSARRPGRTSLRRSEARRRRHTDVAIEAWHRDGMRAREASRPAWAPHSSRRRCSLRDSLCEMLMPRTMRVGSTVVGMGATERSGPTAVEAGSTCSEQDEIYALMRMAGVAESKLNDPATALRVIEQQRRRVVEAGGAMAADEADELARLHEWQMRALSRSRSLAAGATTSAGASGTAGTTAAATDTAHALERSRT